MVWLKSMALALPVTALLFILIAGVGYLLDNYGVIPFIIIVTFFFTMMTIRIVLFEY